MEGAQMSDKSEILRKITSNADERLMLAGIHDKAEISYRTDSPAWTGFLNQREQELASVLANTCGFKGVFWDGGYPGAQRAVLFFLPAYMDLESFQKSPAYPIAALRTSYRLTGFAQRELSHRDLLGAAMALGITRKSMGDILIAKNPAPEEDLHTADLLVMAEIADFVTANLTSAGRVKTNFSPIDLSELSAPDERFVLLRQTVLTPRLDAILSVGFSVSRTEASELIRSGKVTLNGSACQKSDRLLSPGDVFSARGFGKCVLESLEGPTKKGRLFATVKKLL
jgi:RNA-binding protein YlmH